MKINYLKLVIILTTNIFFVLGCGKLSLQESNLDGNSFDGDYAQKNKSISSSNKFLEPLRTTNHSTNTNSNHIKYCGFDVNSALLCMGHDVNSTVIFYGSPICTCIEDTRFPSKTNGDGEIEVVCQCV